MARSVKERLKRLEDPKDGNAQTMVFVASFGNVLRMEKQAK